MGYADGTMQLFVVHFHPYLLHDTSFHTLGVAATQPFAFGERRFLALLPASHPNTPQIVSLLTGIAGEYQAAAIGWEVVTKGYLLQITGLLLRHFLSTTPPDPTVTRREALLARIAPALQLLEQNLVDPPSLADLAATIAVNPNYFCMLFREATGTSPVAYRNLRRVMCAQQLLANGDEPVSLIAERCGFEAVQQFNRVFLRLVGCTPGHYRHRTRDLSPS
jgi:AraC-like DNA-binding protein